VLGGGLKYLLVAHLWNNRETPGRHSPRRKKWLLSEHVGGEWRYDADRDESRPRLRRHERFAQPDYGMGPVELTVNR
jgi:hypothetical protein